MDLEDVVPTVGVVSLDKDIASLEAQDAKLKRLEGPYGSDGDAGGVAAQLLRLIADDDALEGLDQAN